LYLLFSEQFLASEGLNDLLAADSHFIEERRKALRRWLTLVARHPALSGDPLLSFFLTYSGGDVQHKIREIFRRVPDEFTTSELAARAKVYNFVHFIYGVRKPEILLYLNLTFISVSCFLSQTEQRTPKNIMKFVLYSYQYVR
jgi:hypothetical protein